MRRSKLRHPTSEAEQRNFSENFKGFHASAKPVLRQTVVEVYNVSKTFDAPLEFVFDWCTDFREDDGKMVGSKAKHRFLERTDERVVWVTNYEEGGKMMEGFRVCGSTLQTRGTSTHQRT